MDLTAYLLSRVVAATTPPRESAAEAQRRADAIAAMLGAYAPGDSMEAMMACQCIMMQFVVDAAMRDALNQNQEPTVRSKARTGAIMASRVLCQWVTKFENQRKRNERRAAQSAKQEAAKGEAIAPPVPQPPPDVPAPRPIAPTIAHAPVQNARPAVAAGALDRLVGSASSGRSAALEPGISTTETAHGPPLPVSVAA